MGLLTYNSIRIYKKNKQSFTAGECDSLKAFLFNSPRYHSTETKFVSRFTPIIFECTENNLSIEAQFNTYNDVIVWDTIERLYEMTFPYYEFWFIMAHASHCEDKIGRFKSLSIGEESIASTNTDDWQTCRYRFDRIELMGTKKIPESLDHIHFESTDNGLVSTGYSGEYNSYSEKNFSDGQRYKLLPEENSIPLSEKYDRKTGGIEYVSVSGSWYSDDKLARFIHDKLRDSSVEELKFYYRGRLTRCVSRDRFSSILAFDGWDNCSDAEFLAYLKQRIPQRLLTL